MMITITKWCKTTSFDIQRWLKSINARVDGQLVLMWPFLKSFAARKFFFCSKKLTANSNLHSKWFRSKCNFISKDCCFFQTTEKSFKKVLTVEINIQCEWLSVILCENKMNVIFVYYFWILQWASVAFWRMTINATFSNIFSLLNENKQW